MIPLMSDKTMRDDHDPFLTQLFAEQDQSLPVADFMARLVVQVELEQRKQRAYSIIAVVAILAIATLIAPWIAQAMEVLAAVVTECLTAVAPFFQSPLTWLVCGALVFALLPVIYTWRAFRS
jgi:hypothetical protein